MDKKQKIELLFVFLLLLIGAGYMEYGNHWIGENGKIPRKPFGEGKQDMELLLSADDEFENYCYTLTVEEQKVTKKQAEQYLEQAKQEIDATFGGQKASWNHITRSVSIKDAYADGNVRADWFFDKYKYIDDEGNIIETEITDEGELISAEVTLTCGSYRQIYTFPFMVYPRELSASEQLIKKIDKNILDQQSQEGQAYVKLPSEIDGVSLRWSEAREHLILKVMLLEGVILAMLPLVLSSRKKQAIKRRQDALLLDYPEMVSKLNVLVGAGMTTKQAWHTISAQYINKRNKDAIRNSLVYEEMIKTDREIRDGESERNAYQRFGERIGISTYHRFVRLLVQNLQKGNRGICELLEQETESAFAERRLLAKRLGEEAGTKMLFPMMLMMGIVMAIVMVPALIGFSV